MEYIVVLEDRDTGTRTWMSYESRENFLYWYNDFASCAPGRNREIYEVIKEGVPKKEAIESIH